MESNNYKQIANELGMDFNIMMMLANGIVNSLIKDKVDIEKLSNDDKLNVVLAYIPHEVRKLNKFNDIYRTNPEANEYFKKMVFNLLVQ